MKATYFLLEICLKFTYLSVVSIFEVASLQATSKIDTIYRYVNFKQNSYNGNVKSGSLC